MVSVLFSGCSFVQGCGLENEYKNPKHFSNIFSDTLFGSAYHIDNIGVVGYSNERIFLDTATKLIRQKYDYAFVCWTALKRYVFWLGFELYESKRSFNASKIFTFLEDPAEHTDNNIRWTSQELNQLSEKFLLLNHEHYYIRDLIIYTNILINIAQSIGLKLYFINSLLPWDQSYFDYIPTTVTPSMLTEYTNQLLCSNNRDDKDIDRLYHLMHQHYSETGGIREEYWLNLYSSFYSLTIDSGYDQLHPGLKSHKLFAEFLVEEFKKHN